MRLDSLTLIPLPRSRFLFDRHRYAGNLRLERAETRAGAKVDGLPIVASEGDVGRVIEAVHDTAEFLALRVEDVEPARATAVNVAGGVHLHPVGAAWLRSAQVGKDPVGLAGQRAVRLEIEGADMAA